MFYKKIFQKRGIPLLLWSCFSVLYPQDTAAQCTVFFSTCPDNVTIVDCDDNGYEPITWPQPIAATTGGCTNFTLTQTSGPSYGSLVAAPGSYAIKYVATVVDLLTGKKSKVYCTFTVYMIQDSEPPVFTSCPPDITVYAGNQTTANVTWTMPIVTDNCNETVKVKVNAECNSAFEIGMHQITYKAVDAAGNISYCVFTITVLPGFMRPESISQIKTVAYENMPTSPRAYDSASNETEVYLLPNPFNTKLVINTDQEFESDVLVQVFDIQGRLILHQIWSAHSEQAILPAESVPAGIVLVKIVSSDGAFSKVLRGVKL